MQHTLSSRRSSLWIGLFIFVQLSFGAVSGAAEIPNHFVLDASERVHRSSNILNAIDAVKQERIQNVIVLRDRHEKDVETEIQKLRQANIRSLWLPMDWNKPTEPKENCVHAVRAVHAIVASVRRGEKVLFHCTAGQDRTGLVAGLYRMLVQNWSASKAFRDEMCARGYADGGPPSKPAWISKEVRASLTPVFLALSKEIELTGRLTESACEKLPTQSLPTCR